MARRELHAAHLLYILARLFLHHVDDVINGDNPVHAASVIQDRNRQQVVRAH
jgi:hypothetical protein